MLLNCGHKIKYDWRYDVNFCPECDEWIEKNCLDPNCSYCNNRPLKPSISGPVPEEYDNENRKNNEKI